MKYLVNFGFKTAYTISTNQCYGWLVKRLFTVINLQTITELKTVQLTGTGRRKERRFLRDLHLLILLAKTGIANG